MKTRTEYFRKYRAEHKEKIAEYKKRSYMKHREKNLAYIKARNAKLKAQNGQEHTNSI